MNLLMAELKILSLILVIFDAKHVIRFQHLLLLFLFNYFHNVYIFLIMLRFVLSTPFHSTVSLAIAEVNG